MAPGAEIAERKADSFALAKAKRQPTICISVCFRSPDAQLFQLLHSLSRQTYPIGRLNVCLTYLGADVQIVRELQNIQSSYEGKFGAVDINHTTSASEGAAHNKVLATSEADYFLKATSQISFPPQAFEGLLSEAEASARDIGAWELRRSGRQAGHASISDLDRQRSATLCTLYRSEVLQRVGGFAETADLSAMAVEFSYRLRDSGYRIVQASMASYLDQQAEEIPEIGEQSFEAWLSGTFCTMRYGGLGQRLWSLLDLFSKRFATLSPQNERFLKMAMAHPLLLARNTFAGRLSAMDFPICGWQGDFMSAEKRQPRYVRDHIAQTPLVSVVVRARSGQSGSLAECLRSIANQTYPHIEVVIVEGGATGFARALVQQGLFGYGVHVLNLQDAEGYHPARMANMGVQASLGDLILLVDDDQLLFPDHIERCARALAGNPKIPAVYARSRRVDTDVVSSEPYRYVEQQSQIVGDEPAAIIADQWDALPVCALLFRRDAYDYLQGFDEDLKGLAVWHFFRRLSKIGSIDRIGRLTSVCRFPAPGPLRDAFDQDREEARREILDIESGKIRRQTDAPSLLPDQSGT